MEHTLNPCGWARLLVLVRYGLSSPDAMWLGATRIVLSHCPKAGCCHGLNSLHALWLSVIMALLSLRLGAAILKY